jgi:hypothetical protein
MKILSYIENPEIIKKILKTRRGERIGIVFHCLRQTRTTEWVKRGFSDEIIRRATGNRSLEAYQQYVKLDPAAVMRLVETDNSGTKRPKALIVKHLIRSLKTHQYDGVFTMSLELHVDVRSHV